MNLIENRLALWSLAVLRFNRPDWKELDWQSLIYIYASEAGSATEVHGLFAPNGSERLFAESLKIAQGLSSNTELLWRTCNVSRKALLDIWESTSPKALATYQKKHGKIYGTLTTGSSWEETAAPNIYSSPGLESLSVSY